MHTNVTQMCIRAQPFSTYHGKICSDHVLFIPTWMSKRVQDLDLRNDADCELLSYGAYVYALGCHLMVNVQWVIPSRHATWRSLRILTTGRTRHFFLQVCCGARVAHGQVRRAKFGFREGVLATTTAVGRSFVLRVWMCQIIFHHSQGILRH